MIQISKFELTIFKMDETSKGRRLPDAMKLEIIRYSDDGTKEADIVKRLSSEHSYVTTRSTVNRFLRKYRETGTLAPFVRHGSPKKILPIHREFIDMWMHEDNEMSTKEIQRRLKSELDVEVSDTYIRKIKKALGWTTRRMQYCQLISHKNKQIRLEWCSEMYRIKEEFRNVIFVDETTVEMSSCGRIFFHKKMSDLNVMPAKKPKPKHSYKVHVWGGISYQGRTDICIFTGVMDSITYQGILERNLIPFVERVFPEGFRLYQDNDSKHNSRSTKSWMTDKGIADKVMSTPPSSPDLNPIENLWSEMKNFLCSNIKPKRKEELVAGIRSFWESVDVNKCVRYIDHVHKVIPAVILNDGNPTQY